MVMYMKIVNSDPELASAMWETMGLEAKDFFGFMEHVTGIRLAGHDSSLLEEHNEADLDGAL